MKFGEKVEGYSLPVLNEREIRASAGILFLLTYTSLMLIIFKENFLLIKYVITSFFADFAIRLFISPKYAPTLILGRLVVRNQTPEYVSAAPKRFAWVIGLVLSGIMLALMVVINSYSIITGLICLICLVFLFFESVFGICLGCLFYPLFFKKEELICPGGVCETKEKHDIQKITWKQILMVNAIVIFIVVLAILFNDSLSVSPTDLWERF